MSPLELCSISTGSSMLYHFFRETLIMRLAEIRPIPWFLTEGEVKVLADPST